MLASGFEDNLVLLYRRFFFLPPYLLVFIHEVTLIFAPWFIFFLTILLTFTSNFSLFISILIYLFLASAISIIIPYIFSLFKELIFLSFLILSFIFIYLASIEVEVIFAFDYLISPLLILIFFPILISQAFFLFSFVKAFPTFILLTLL